RSCRHSPPACALAPPQTPHAAVRWTNPFSWSHAMQHRRWILATAIVCALGACSSPSDPASRQSPAVDASAAAHAATAATPAPAATASGIDMDAIDKAVKPGDDFFMYANGSWYEHAKIPSDRSSVGTFLTVYKKTQKHVTDIIKQAAESHPEAGSEARKIADYYAAFMDTDATEKHGLEPLKPLLDAVAGIQSREDLARVLSSRLRQDVDPINATDFRTPNLFGLFVAQGLDDPSHNIAYLLQGGLALPGRDYYLSDDDTMAGYRDKYLAYIQQLYELAGRKDPEASARRVLDLETKIAKAQASLTESEDVHKANTLWSAADFADKAPGLDWKTYFKAASLDGQKTID